MKKVVGSFLLVSLVLAGVVLFRAATWRSVQMANVTPVDITVDEAAVAARFSGALQFRTISNEDRTDVDSAAFRGLHNYFAERYPLLHETLELETVGGLSLLYTWRGTDSDAAPLVLMGHQDVVPIAPGTEADWEHAPFSGTIADGFVWGRGALDNKNSVVSVLEAVEALVAHGFQPRRTVYLAFGHDEEVGGAEGAVAIASLLETRGVDDLALVLDEGGAITRGQVPGIEGPVAMIAIAEKGYASLELRVESTGGHSSMPPTSTAVGVVASAITALEADPFASGLSEPMARQFSHMGPEMGFGAKLMLANLWLFEPLLLRFMESDPASAAMVRTTTAATMIDGGDKANVLPSHATATINFRIAPGETVESVADRARRVIADDRVVVTVGSPAVDPSRVSDPDSPAFRLLERTIHETAGGESMVVTPFLLPAATDSRHFAALSSHVFRFLPMDMGPTDAGRFHGTNERISTRGLANSVRFFQQLIHNSDELQE